MSCVSTISLLPRSSCPQCEELFSQDFPPHICQSCQQLYCYYCVPFIIKLKLKQNQLAQIDDNNNNSLEDQRVCRVCVISHVSKSSSTSSHHMQTNQNMHIESNQKQTKKIKFSIYGYVMMENHQ